MGTTNYRQGFVVQITVRDLKKAVCYLCEGRKQRPVCGRQAVAQLRFSPEITVVSQHKSVPSAYTPPRQACHSEPEPTSFPVPVISVPSNTRGRMDGIRKAPTTYRLHGGIQAARQTGDMAGREAGKGRDRISGGATRVVILQPGLQPGLRTNGPGRGLHVRGSRSTWSDAATRTGNTATRV